MPAGTQPIAFSAIGDVLSLTKEPRDTEVVLELYPGATPYAGLVLQCYASLLGNNWSPIQCIPQVGTGAVPGGENIEIADGVPALIRVAGVQGLSAVKFVITELDGGIGSAVLQSGSYFTSAPSLAGGPGQASEAPAGNRLLRRAVWCLEQLAGEYSGSAAFIDDPTS